MKKLAAVMVMFIGSVVAFGQTVITNVYVQSSTATTATIVWTTSTPSTSQILYGTSIFLQYSNSVNSSLVTSHTSTLKVLNANQPYYFAAVSVDGSSRSAQSATYEFALCGTPLVPVNATVNQFYYSGTYSITWNPPSGSSGPITVCGQSVATTVTGNLNLAGSFSAQVADALKVTPGPGTWTVSVADIGDLSPISVTLPLSASTQDISSQLQSAAVATSLVGVIANNNAETVYPPWLETIISDGCLNANSVAKGCTGVTSFTPYALLAGGTTGTGAMQQVSLGTAGQPILSGGNAALPAPGTLGATYGGTGQDTHTATGVPQLNSGTWSVSTALANGTTATTQTSGDNTTQVATDAFATAIASNGCLGGNSISNGCTGATTAAGALSNLQGISSVQMTPQTMAGPLNMPYTDGVINASLQTGADGGSKLAAAVTAACAAGVKVVDARGFGAGNQTVSSTVSLGCGTGPTLEVLLDQSTHWVPATSGLDMFLILPGGLVHNVAVDVTGVAGYSGNAVKLAGNYGNQPGDSTGPRTQLDGYNFYGTGNTTATALLLSSTSASTPIQYADFVHININGGLYGILMSATGGGWVNGNKFDSVVITNAVHHWKMIPDSTSSVVGNQINKYQTEIGANTLDYLWITGGLSGALNCAWNNFTNTHLWDMNTLGAGQHTILVDANCSQNFIEGFLGSYVTGAVVDNTSNQSNQFYDTQTATFWGQRTFNNVVNATMFNASSLASYQIQGHTFIYGDGASTIIQPMNGGYAGFQLAGGAKQWHIDGNGSWSNQTGAILPTGLTGYHGTSGTTVQLSDGTGTSGPAYFAADGSLTTGGIANIQITTGTTAIAANTCTANTATAMTGLLTTSAIIPPTPTTSTAAVTGWGAVGGLSFTYYPTAATFNYSICNTTASSITPGASVTWNIGAR